MHLAYLDTMRNVDLDNDRRRFLTTAGASILVGGLAPSLAFAADAGRKIKGFKGKGAMDSATAEDWIDTFFNGGASEIIHYYADNFVFEDVTLFQTINTKDELYRAFLPFNNAGPDSPAGVHQFDVIRYDGAHVAKGKGKGVARKGIPEGYTPELWNTWSKDSLAGIDLDYDEWGAIQWVWKARHNMDDFLGLKGAKGKTTYCRGMTFHCYKNRKIVREFTHWNLRDVGVQLGALPAPQLFWKKA